MKNLSKPNSKITKQGTFAILIALLMMLSLVANVGAVVKDLTPDYRKAGSLIDVLSWDIYGPPGNTSLTQIQFGYSGTNSVTDMEYVQFYANNTLLGTVYQVGVVIFNPAYKILAGDMVTITMKIKIADTGVHGNHVDGYIVNYVLTYPGATGTDVVPANPAGYTIIDNLRPAVVDAWADPDPTDDGWVDVYVLFNDTMLYESPNVTIDGLATVYSVSQYDYDTTTYTNDTWIGKFYLLDQNEEATATILVEDGEDMAMNVMLANHSAGYFVVDTVNPGVSDYTVSDYLITDADVGDTFYVQVTYNETMDTTVNPSVSFNKAVTGTLSSPSVSWISNNQYRVSYTIVDGNEEVNDVDTTWTGAQDLVGNVQELFTSSDPFDIDTKNPTVTSIVVSDLNITEADVGGYFWVNVTFSEVMDDTVTPTIEFINDVSSTLSFSSDAWDLGDTRYTANYSIADLDQTEYNVDVNVSGAKDLVGNDDPTIYSNMFDVDTVKPEVVSATAVPSLAKEGTVTVTVVFSETMDTTTSPTVTVTNLSGPDYTVSGSFASGTTWVGTFTLLDNEEEATAYISVVGGKDARGNTMLDDTTAGSFEVDTEDPEVTDLQVSDDLITEADIPGNFYVYMNFSETMKNTVAPTILFSPDVNASGTLTFVSGAWDLIDTRYTATYTIADVNETQYGVDVAVVGAEDLAGNDVDLSPWTDMFDVDTEKPEVDEFWVSDENVTEADVGGNFYVHVIFSEEMNSSVDPTIGFTENVAATLTFFGGSWSDPDYFVATYNITDGDQEVFGVGVDISGGIDSNGNLDAEIKPMVFDVDTVKPEVVSATAVPSLAKEETVTVTVVFSETMDTTTNPTVTVMGLDDSPYAVVKSSFSGDTWVGTFTLDDDEEEVTATISVSGGKDARGNTMLAEPTAGTFYVDTKDPMVTDLAVSDELINEADAGDLFYVSMNFSETMNTAVAPTIVFSPDVETSGTLTFISGAWDLIDTRYTATYTIADVNETQYGVDVTVSGAQDLIGNIDPTTETNMFDVDTVAPTVDDIEVSDEWIKEDDIPGTFEVTVTFSEPMNIGVIPDIDFDPDVSSTLVNESGAWSAGDTVYTFTYDIADADVVVNNVGVTVGGAEDAAGNPDPLTEEDLFDIDTLHHAGVPEYIDVWAEYSAPMSITLNANEVAWPIEGLYSEWNSPEDALVSDDESAFLTWADGDPCDNTMILLFEEPPEDLDIFEIKSVKLHVEQKIVSDFSLFTDDRWVFGVGNKNEYPWSYDTWIYRPGTEEEHTMSIDITHEGLHFYSSELSWENVTNMAVMIAPCGVASDSGEWYVDNVWIEVNYIYEDEGPSITVPVGGKADVYANVTDWFNDTVPDGTIIHFETDLGTINPLTDTTTAGIAKTTIISTDVGPATVNASGSLNGICEVTFVAHKLDVELSAGWNLISVPRKLENTSIEAVFENITTITKIYTYQNGDWTGSAYDGAWNELITGHPIEDIEDGIGYWVYATESTVVTLSLEPLGYVQVTPPDYDLSMGWTMIGYTTLQLEPEMPVPVYLTNLDGKWQSLYSYTPTDGYDQAKPLDYGFKNTELGRGYWIYLNEVGVLVP